MINGRNGKYLTLFLVAGVGIILSFILSYWFFAYERRKIRDEFYELANYRFKYIENIFENAIFSLSSFGDLYAATQVVERDEFDSFAQGIFLRQPYIFEFRWLPRVRLSQRQAFEEAGRSSALPGFKIKELNKKEEFVSAGEREEYFPNYYISHSPSRKYEHSHIIGLDAASFPERWQVMQHARDTAEPATAVEVKHFGVPQINTASHVYLPIYNNTWPLKERRDNLLGFVTLLYRLDQMIEFALKGLPIKGVDSALYDLSGGGKKLLYSYSRSGKEMPGGIYQIIRSSLEWSRPLKVADRQWLITCVPNAEFLAARKIILPWVTLGMGLILTFLLAAYLSLLVGRNKSVQLLVDKRTEELKESGKALAAANEELKKLDRLKSDFVSTVSHELRTPLAITKEGVSLVLDGIAGEIGEKQAKILITARSNIDRLARIINSLLNISQIESGKITLKYDEVDVTALLRQVVSSFEAPAKEKGLELKIDVPPAAVYAYIDSDRIIQVLTNLIANALKFTLKGVISVSLEDRATELECCVSDTGIGIHEEDLPKVFGKFQQFSRTAGAGEKGTGLGLSIASGLIQMHKGKIWLESKVDQGTKFFFTLPKNPPQTKT